MTKAQERIGEQIGEYRLQTYLGRGSFGTVYLATHVHTQAQAAIKLLNTPLMTSEEWQAFVNEARSIRLQHPHIMPLLDFGVSHEEMPFLVMEYAAGVRSGRSSSAKPVCPWPPLPPIRSKWPRPCNTRTTGD